jgi:hypothetical protein
MLLVLWHGCNGSGREQAERGSVGFESLSQPKDDRLTNHHGPGYAAPTIAYKQGDNTAYGEKAAGGIRGVGAYMLSFLQLCGSLVPPLHANDRNFQTTALLQPPTLFDTKDRLPEVFVIGCYIR